MGRPRLPVLATASGRVDAFSGGGGGKARRWWVGCYVVDGLSNCRRRGHRQRPRERRHRGERQRQQRRRQRGRRRRGRGRGGRRGQGGGWADERGQLVLPEREPSGAGKMRPLPGAPRRVRAEPRRCRPPLVSSRLVCVSSLCEAERCFCSAFGSVRAARDFAARVGVRRAPASPDVLAKCSAVNLGRRLLLLRAVWLEARGKALDAPFHTTLPLS